MTGILTKARKAMTAIALAGVAMASPCLAPAKAAAWTPTSDDALLFDVKLGRYRLGDGVRGYQTPRGPCLDLGDTVMALDIPLRVDKKLRRATGWAFDERRTITIDRENSTVQIMNKSVSLAPGDIIDAPEGWCVRASLLADWFGIGLAPDLAAATLIVSADRKLPVETAIERRERAAKVRPVTSFDLKNLPQAKAPFGGIATPSVDAVVTLGGLRQGGSHRAQITSQFELFTAGEVGPVAYDARLASDRVGKPESLRVRAYRTDPDGGLLGPLKATHVAVGDVGGVSTPLVSQSPVGRGAIITNRPIERIDAFDRTDFRGVLPAGWDAELYRNGQLLGFATDRADGRYEFLDVQLLYGQNRFEVVLYGPQGQIRREQRNVPVGIDSIPPRQTWYWGGVIEDGVDLIGLTQGSSRSRQSRGGWRGTFGFERGLDARTSIGVFGHNLTPRDSTRRTFLETALRRAVGPTLVEFSAAGGFGASLGPNYALRGQMLAQIGRTNLSIETINAYGGYRSDRLVPGATGQHRVAIDQTIAFARAQIPVHVDATYATFADGARSLTAIGRVAAMIGRLAVSTELEWEHRRAAGGARQPDALSASVLGNARIGGVRLRGESRFRIRPDARFESATLVGEWSAASGSERFRNDWRAEIGYDQSGRARAALGLIRRFKSVAVTGTVEAATDGSVAAGLNLAFSLGPDPRRGGLRVTSERLASHGQAVVRAFRDVNGDGVRQPDEPGEPDVQITAGRVPVDDMTDRTGIVIVDGLAPFSPVLIGIDASSLPDPLVQPATAGVVVTPRPGVSVRVDIPLVSAGEIDGMLVRSGGGALEGVDLELIDVEGRVAMRTRTDYDGYFLFEGVPYGRYSVRIAALSAQASRVAVALLAQATVGAKTPSAHLGTVTTQPVVRQAANPAAN